MAQAPFYTGGMAEQVYQPRNPKASPLWRCVDAHFEEFLQVYSERYQPRYGVSAT